MYFCCNIYADTESFRNKMNSLLESDPEKTFEQIAIEKYGPMEYYEDYHGDYNIDQNPMVFAERRSADKNSTLGFIKDDYLDKTPTANDYDPDDPSIKKL